LLQSLQTVALSATGGEEDLFRSFLRQAASADLQQVVATLAVEFAALFLNASQRSVHPFESVYTSAERLMLQQSRDEVLAEYRRAGLERSADFKEPEDHVALELEFMAFLCRRAAAVMQEQEETACLAFLERQKAFLEGHLLVWLPAFCSDLEKASESDFYRGIARLTREFIQSEREAIMSLIEHVRE